MSISLAASHRPSSIRSPRWIAGITGACSLMLAAAPGLAEEPAADVKPAEIKQIAAGDLTLTAPATWESQQPSNSMRKAQIRLPGAGEAGDAEIAVFVFPGGAGGVNANVNRWVGQFSPDGRTTKVLKGTSTQGKYVLVDVTGTYNQSVGPPIMGKTKAVPGSRMLALIVMPEGKNVHYVKLTGPEQTVTAAADALRTAIGAKTADEKEIKQ